MRLYHVNAFTRIPFTGNPATVVLDADGQSDAALLRIAKEYAPAEVAFVSAATAADHDLRVRFFNARKEAPFVGHATVAAHAVLRSIGERTAGICRQQSGTGIIEVRMSERQADLVEFRQLPPELGGPLTRESTLRIADALRLSKSHLHATRPVCVARKGGARMLVPVSDAGALATLAPDVDTLLELGCEFKVDGFFTFAVEKVAKTGSLATEARMFCPALGIAEDPVSGNAHAMLAAYLWQLGEFEGLSHAFVGRQGGQMQRPGEVAVELETSRGELAAVRIGGSAIIISQGVLLH
ncbi:MAG: PhzF family phenazine biosynthesis isomerase [Pseudomonadota bacterium]|nr:PhzF family phenazine biosynthesis isomerase [Pseudomonadota bacterium]